MLKSVVMITEFDIKASSKTISSIVILVRINPLAVPCSIATFAKDELSTCELVKILLLPVPLEKSDWSIAMLFAELLRIVESSIVELVKTTLLPVPSLNSESVITEFVITKLLASESLRSNSVPKLPSKEPPENTESFISTSLRV